MMRWFVPLMALLLAGLSPAAADDLVAGLSQDKIQITSSYSGTDLVVFGAVESGSDAKGRDVVVVIRGPTTTYTARRKARVAGIWVNSDRVVVRGMPSFYYLATTRPIDLLANEDTLGHYSIG
ncbi:MAG TPA: TIGR02186 family protein, partial [Rhizomicrobium sp.]|nr:TIGR02186 family protein [Rhizomicrobium sp.]